jgi:hypothetical protein
MDARWFAFAVKPPHWAAGESTSLRNRLPSQIALSRPRRPHHTIEHDVGPGAREGARIRETYAASESVTSVVLACCVRFPCGHDAVGTPVQQPGVIFAQPLRMLRLLPLERLPGGLEPLESVAFAAQAAIP